MLIMRTLLVLLIPTVWIWGCRGSTSAVGVNTEVAGNLRDYPVQQVAVMGFANMTGEPEAEKLAEHVTIALAASGRFHISDMGEFESDAGRANVLESHGELLRRWKKKREIDGKKVQELLTKTGYDALVLMEFTAWKMVKINPLQEGTSQTTVGLGVSMYAADSTRVWSSQTEETAHSIPYNPQSASASSVDRDFHSTSGGSVPDPPAIDVVARTVAAKIASTLPEFGTPSPMKGP